MPVTVLMAEEVLLLLAAQAVNLQAVQVRQPVAILRVLSNHQPLRLVQMIQAVNLQAAQVRLLAAILQVLSNRQLLRLVQVIQAVTLRVVLP